MTFPIVFKKNPVYLTMKVLLDKEIRLQVLQTSYKDTLINNYGVLEEDIEYISEDNYFLYRDRVEKNRDLFCSMLVIDETIATKVNKRLLYNNISNIASLNRKILKYITFSYIDQASLRYLLNIDSQYYLEKYGDQIDLKNKASIIASKGYLLNIFKNKPYFQDLLSMVLLYNSNFYFNSTYLLDEDIKTLVYNKSHVSIRLQHKLNYYIQCNLKTGLTTMEEDYLLSLSNNLYITASNMMRKPRYFLPMLLMNNKGKTFDDPFRILGVSHLMYYANSRNIKGIFPDLFKVIYGSKD